MINSHQIKHFPLPTHQSNSARIFQQQRQLSHKASRARIQYCYDSRVTRGDPIAIQTTPITSQSYTSTHTPPQPPVYPLPFLSIYICIMCATDRTHQAKKEKKNKTEEETEKKSLTELTRDNRHNQQHQHRNNRNRNHTIRSHPAYVSPSHDLTQQRNNSYLRAMPLSVLMLRSRYLSLSFNVLWVFEICSLCTLRSPRIPAPMPSVSFAMR